MSRPGVILLVGASAAGKSRLLDGVDHIAAQSGVLPGVRTATRFTTREPRETESSVIENRFVDAETFEAGVADGVIDVAWSRPISPSADNRYGFALRAEMLGDGLVILSANNYLSWMENELLWRLRAERRLMVVRVFASTETRLARLRARRPAPTDEELELRMLDVQPTVLPAADHVIPNDPEFQASAEWEFVRLLTQFRFSLLTAAESPSIPTSTAGAA